MLDRGELYRAALPLGRNDHPAMVLREGEGMILEKVKKIGPVAVVVEVNATLPDGSTLPFRFLASDRNFYRKNGPKDRLRPGHLRVIRTQALALAIERVSLLRKLSPQVGPISYNELATQSVMVDDMRVGPFADPESVALFVKLLTSGGAGREKYVVLGTEPKNGRGPQKSDKKKIAVVSSDEGITLEGELLDALKGIATKEFRRLGVAV